MNQKQKQLRHYATAAMQAMVQNKHFEDGQGLHNGDYSEIARIAFNIAKTMAVEEKESLEEEAIVKRKCTCGKVYERSSKDVKDLIEMTKCLDPKCSLDKAYGYKLKNEIEYYVEEELYKKVPLNKELTKNPAI